MNNKTTNSKKDYLKDILWRSLITLPKNFTGLITLPLLTHTYTKDLYAVWTQIFILNRFLSPVLTMQLDIALVRFLSIEPDKTRLIRSTTTITFLLSSLIIFLGFVFREPLSYLFFGSTVYANIIFISLLIAGISALNTNLIGALRAEKKIISLSIRESTADAWLLVIVIIAYFQSWSLTTLLWSYLLGIFFIFCYLIFQLQIFNPLILSSEIWRTLKKYFTFCMPLIVSVIFAFVSRTVDRFIIVHQLSLNDLAVYSVAVQFSNILSVIFNPINFVLFPHLTNLWNKEAHTETSNLLTTTSNMIFVLAIPSILGITLLAPNLIELIVGKNYEVSQFLVFLLSLCALFQIIYQNNVYILTLKNKTIYIPLIFASAFLINFVVGMFLTSKAGILGTAFGKLFASLFLMGSVTLWSRKSIKTPMNYSIILKASLASLVMALGIYFIPHHTFLWLLFNIVVGIILYGIMLLLLKIISMNQLTSAINLVLRRKTESVSP